MPFTVTLSRRLVLATGAALLVPLPRAARAQGTAAATILSVADLHSAYGRMPQLLSAIRAEAADAGDAVIVLNGDLFELANPVATRSRGEADLAFLTALSEIAPTYVNLGNHEPDFVSDMAEVPEMIARTGAMPLSNIADARTGEPYAIPTATITLGGRDYTALALATDNLFTYPEAIRPQLAVPIPTTYASEIVPSLPDARVLLLSHAGVTADKEILPLLPAGSLAIGAHDHLTFTYREPLPYTQGGAWGRTLTRIDLAAEGEARFEQIDIDMDAEGDVDLAALIARLETEHLTEEDRTVVGTAPRTMDLREAILFAVEAVRERAGADLALLGHTTFGTGLKAGPVRRYDFDAYIRFDGDIVATEVDGATLRSILARANQHEAATLDERTGDYVHAAKVAVDDGETYRLATNGWTAMNQARYLGTEDLEFAPVEGLTLKGAVANALS
jgi:2',3'-cyclic-nucleotide 2'-phosphodiesterase (5'-nucleotidase family)